MRSRRALTISGALSALIFVLALTGCGGAHRHTTTSTTVAPPTTTATTPTTPPPAPPPQPRTTTFGPDVGGIFFNNPAQDPGFADRELAAAAADGLGIARAAPLWEATEPNPPQAGRHDYDWRFDDFIASRLAAHGFRWIAVLAFAPGWASQTPAQLHGAPRGEASYAAYAGAFARRYRGQIAAYEVWNEENSAVFWRPTPDPATYARLYQSARAAIHAADPRTPVLVGGLADTGGPSFLSALLRQPHLRGQVDGVAVHPYGRNPAAVVGRVRDYRRELRSLGVGGTPLYVTEYGWTTSPVGSRTWAPEDRRGGYIGRVAEALLRSDCSVRMAIFFAWTTPQRSPAVPDDWYGIASRNAAPTPVTAAVGRTARALLRPGGAPVRVCGP